MIRVDAAIRDIPASCTCRWRWRKTLAAWVWHHARRDCPWHTR